MVIINIEFFAWNLLLDQRSTKIHVMTDLKLDKPTYDMCRNKQFGFHKYCSSIFAKLAFHIYCCVRVRHMSSRGRQIIIVSFISSWFDNIGCVSYCLQCLVIRAKLEALLPAMKARSVHALSQKHLPLTVLCCMY